MLKLFPKFTEDFEKIWQKLKHINFRPASLAVYTRVPTKYSDIYDLPTYDCHLNVYFYLPT